MLITAHTKKTFWSTHINTDNGYINTFIPSDCFQKIANYVLDNNKLDAFFTKIINKLSQLANNEIEIRSSSDK